MEGDRIQLHPSCGSLWLPASPRAPSLQGANYTLVFENSGGEELQSLEMPLVHDIVDGENEDEGLDMSVTQQTKRRRLTWKQLEFLESNFAMDSKLGPERKLQLAGEIGLQPRQVAVWFQNRRARFKSKRLEKDYDSLSVTQQTKKRRLTSKQLEFLQSNCAMENKLEPEKKLQLAGEIGLQPRQVAVWFRNRRARFKNKRLEKDYDSLKGSFEKLKAEFEILVKEKESLESEVSSLKGKLASREKGLLLETLQPLESYYPPRSTAPWEEAGEGEKSCKLPVVTNTTKKEDASLAKSDLFDSYSPLSLLGPDQSDHFSQDEVEDHQLQQPFGSCFLSSSPPKHFPDPSPDSINYGFPVEDQPFWNWTSYYGGMY